MKMNAWIVYTDDSKTEIALVKTAGFLPKRLISAALWNNVDQAYEDPEWLQVSGDSIVTINQYKKDEVLAARALQIKNEVINVEELIASVSSEDRRKAKERLVSLNPNKRMTQQETSEVLKDLLRVLELM